MAEIKFTRNQTGKPELLVMLLAQYGLEQLNKKIVQQEKKNYSLYDNTAFHPQTEIIDISFVFIPFNKTAVR